MLIMVGVKAEFQALLRLGVSRRRANTVPCTDLYLAE